ncbi:MAG TPA: stage V sporulation protein T [Ruminiclostridium sp.]|uniref:Stage V sporulation protein T n=1 Tax=Acetivibrio saccincola TaxID=1677857 RepID=A0A2K9DX50_9FIRM|nr:stage V sporulation protein T [Acetivibrio saccincola]HAA43062.1 stage V sporulation protein T [Ruminiclostridium sp.]AUG56092.1 Stage V sporulation protein T [Acetivibrio saccincola]NLW26182.1 stage V sporulation protein T [Acetivibrio saccincola]PQQ65722.1 stage V sporulation protein T [Acetivibrio saccincola]HQD27751.1 stage V sporulation protein T [Acetivibrio saccincola]
MKATGIVRRIDDLGRVVIPKEIRRTLKIREGDPLEIFTDREGEVILKKYSPIGELSDFAAQYAESLHKTSGHVTCISDRDTIIAVSGTSKKEFMEKPLSPDLEKIMEDKVTFIVEAPGEKTINILAEESPDRHYSAQVVSPIISEGDPIGAVIFLSTDPNIRMGEVEAKLAQAAASFLGKQMEQ